MGIILGIPVALWIGNFQERRTGKERRKKVLSILKVEIAENLMMIIKWNKSENKRIESFTLSAYLKDESWSAFSDGGELECIKDPMLLSELSDAYNVIRSIKLLSERYFRLVEFPTA